MCGQVRVEEELNEKMERNSFGWQKLDFNR